MERLEIIPKLNLITKQTPPLCFVEVLLRNLKYSFRAMPWLLNYHPSGYRLFPGRSTSTHSKAQSQKHRLCNVLEGKICYSPHGVKKQACSDSRAFDPSKLAKNYTLLSALSFAINLVFGRSKQQNYPAAPSRFDRTYDQLDHASDWTRRAS